MLLDFISNKQSLKPNMEQLIGLKETVIRIAKECFETVLHFRQDGSNPLRKKEIQVMVNFGELILPLKVALIASITGNFTCMEKRQETLS
jgi:hypothetical protein